MRLIKTKGKRYKLIISYFSIIASFNNQKELRKYFRREKRLGELNYALELMKQNKHNSAYFGLVNKTLLYTEVV